MKRADFRTFYRDAHAVECLTDREKMLIGLTVAMMRLVRPVSRTAPCGRKESGDDRRRTGRGGGCHRRGGCGRAAVAESENQTKKQDIEGSGG